MFDWAWPWLALLLPLPWLAARVLPAAEPAPQAALRMPHDGLGDALQAGSNAVPRQRRVLLTLAWLLLLAAAARPQWLGEPVGVPHTGRDLLLAVDTSGSMAIRDMEIGGMMVDRFTAIRAIAGDFISRRAGDRVGLILFGSNAYLLVPLTLDLASVATQLEQSTIGLAGRETAIGDAIGLAVKRLRERPAEQRVLVLLTDGVNNAGVLDPHQAIELAEAEGLRVYAIGVGAQSLRVDSLFGSRVVNPSADLDEPMLTELAQRTGGRYFRARDSAELAQIYDEINRLEPAATAQQLLRPTRELFRIPLFLAMLCAVAGSMLPSWRRVARMVRP